MALKLPSNPTTLLDEALEGLQPTASRSARTRELGRLFDGLNGVRSALEPKDWEEFLDAVAQHPVLERIHEDPMTRRSFEKPRGYAGDAVLLDYIYRERGPVQASDTGQSVYSYAVARPAACAVRHRRDWLAFQIDAANDRAVQAGTDGARVLSIACGHLREGELSSALQSGALDRFVALDSDAESLAVIEDKRLPNVTTTNLSIARLLGRWKQLGKFDLVYSAGLYDYLERDLAQRLTRRMFDMLEPGGRILFTNFLHVVRDAGYMEALMGWKLIYRDLEELHDITGLIEDHEVSSRRVFEDPYQAIGYCEVIKR